MCVSLTHCDQGLHWRRPLLRQLKVALTIQLFCVYCATRERPLAIVCNSLSPSPPARFFPCPFYLSVCVCQVTKSTRTNPRLISVLSFRAKSNALQPALSCGDSCVSKDPLDTGAPRETSASREKKIWTSIIASWVGCWLIHLAMVVQKKLFNLNGVRLTLLILDRFGHTELRDLSELELFFSHHFAPLLPLRRWARQLF